MPEDVKPAGQDAPAKPAPSADQDVPFHEHPRWKEVYGELQEYKKLGKPEDITATGARLRYYEQVIAQAEAEAAREAQAPPKDANKAAWQAQARKELLELAPELGDIPGIKNALQLFDVIFKAAVVKARKETAKLMKDAGIPNTETRMLEESLAAIIGGDNDLYTEYLTDPKAAVQEAFARFQKSFPGPKQAQADAAKMQRDKEKLTALPRPFKSGGTPGEPISAPPESKTIKDATKNVMAKLKALSAEE